MWVWGCTGETVSGETHSLRPPNSPQLLSIGVPRCGVLLRNGLNQPTLQSCNFQSVSPCTPAAKLVPELLLGEAVEAWRRTLCVRFVFYIHIRRGCSVLSTQARWPESPSSRLSRDYLTSSSTSQLSNWGPQSSINSQMWGTSRWSLESPNHLEFVDYKLNENGGKLGSISGWGYIPAFLHSLNNPSK